MAADEYSYAKTVMGGYNPNLINRLAPASNISDDSLSAYGLYSKEVINTAKFNNYSRFGRVIDPYGRLNDTREYLFFVKPNLHILAGSSTEEGRVEYSANGLSLNPELNNNRYFRDLIYRHPDVVRSLTKNAPGSRSGDPFCHLLSFTVNSSLDIPSSEFTTMDLPATMLGTSYEYLGNAEASDENPSFSLEFLDNKYLDTYHFFRAYDEYQTVRKSGLVTPPGEDYWRYKRLHNTMGVYKFLVAEDMETITKADLRTLLHLLNPFAPHITEEINKIYNLGEPLCESTWPTYDEDKTKDDSYELVFQVNGKVRGKEVVNTDITKDEMEKLAQKNENVKKFIENKAIVKIITIPGRLVNIVVK